MAGFNLEQCPNARVRSILKRGRRLRALRNWIPKSRAEKGRENLELKEMNEEIEAALASLSPEAQLEIRCPSPRNNSQDAGRRLDDLLTAVHDHIYWVAVIPVLIAIYLTLRG